MQKNTETKSIEDWVQHLKSLTPEGRRDFAIKMREEQIKFSNRYIIVNSISALIFLFASVYLWGHVYHMSRESTFGMLIGLTLFFIGFQLMKSSIIYEPFKNFYPDDFTDEDIFVYFQEISKDKQKSSRLVKIGKFYFLAIASAFSLSSLSIFLHISYFPYEFLVSVFPSGISMLAICQVFYLYKKTRMNKSGQQTFRSF